VYLKVYKSTQSILLKPPCDRDALHWFIVPEKQRSDRRRSMGCCFEVCRSGHASTKSSASRRSGVSKGGGVGKPTDGLPRSLLWSLDSSRQCKVNSSEPLPQSSWRPQSEYGSGCCRTSKDRLLKDHLRDPQRTSTQRYKTSLLEVLPVNLTG
jgi:hypothetical protein